MKVSKIHFIGIGGISMSGLALIAKSKGYDVSGSDIHENPVLAKLKEAGINVYIGHREENAYGADLVVYTGAISGDNPELNYARKNKIKTIKRSKFIQLIMRQYPHSVAVSGCHGKTTTTAMLKYALKNLNPSVHVGGICDGENTTAGGGDIFVCEACEFQRSFLDFHPEIAVVLNIALDHTDCYKNLADIQKAFYKFCRQSKVQLINGDDPNCLFLFYKYLNSISFGLNDYNYYQARNVKAGKNTLSFDFYKGGVFEKTVNLNIGLKHNVYNALAAVCVADLLGNLDFTYQLEAFSGVDRRNQFVAEINGATVFEDYAHHPKEIETVIKEHKEFCKGNLYVVFEPHTYSRTKSLETEFLTCFSGADEVALLPIYPAREKPISGVTSKALAEKLNALYFASYEEAKNYYLAHLKKNDVLLLLGAGDITNLAQMFKC